MDRGGADVQDGGEEDDDYMSMSFAEPAVQKHESSLQRKARQRQEAQKRVGPKSKKQLEAEADAAREEALSSQLSSQSKGFKLLSKLGYKPGMSLGKSGTGATLEPIRVEVKEDRAGIGRESEKKRKAQEILEASKTAKRQAHENEVDYRDRMAEERAESRREGQIYAAQKVAEKFDVRADEESGHPPRPLKGINVLWREQARRRIFKEQEERMKKDLFSRGNEKLPGFEDADEDADYKLALGKDGLEFLEEEVEDEDLEVDEFNALATQERLDRLIKYLRDTYNYCFWCKFEYPDDELDGCPGLSEEEHD